VCADAHEESGERLATVLTSLGEMDVRDLEPRVGEEDTDDRNVTWVEYWCKPGVDPLIHSLRWVITPAVIVHRSVAVEYKRLPPLFSAISELK
jgi:hypothetical protein